MLQAGLLVFGEGRQRYVAGGKEFEPKSGGVSGDPENDVEAPVLVVW